MADLKVGNEDVIKGLTETFRTVGFDGASLNDLAQASGLKKASLYHRFPGGKQEMAQEVSKFSDDWITKNVSSILKNEGDPHSRLKKTLKKINELYSGGKKACLLRSLSIGNEVGHFQKNIESTFANLKEGLKKLALDFGFSNEEASELALNTLIKIQGSLVVSKGMENTSIFKKALKSIEKDYSSQMSDSY